MKKTAAYIRVSTEEQKREGLSAGEQRTVLEQWARDNGRELYKVYDDSGFSGRKSFKSRPAMRELLNDVKEDKIDLIIFIRLDRWFRSVSDYYEVQKILDAHHVTWRATQEDYETVTASGRFKVNIMLAVAQDEADRTSERIKFVFEGKRERNESTGGQLPKGYKRVNKHVELDPDVAPSVRSAFEMYMETGSPARVIRSFPELNLNYQSFRRMVMNKGYTGQYNAIQIPPIITSEEFDRISKLRGSNVRKTKVNRVYLFSGLLFCPECGGRMGGCSSHRKSGDCLYYRCSAMANYRGCSFQPYIPEKVIEQYLLEHLEDAVKITLDAKSKSKPKSYQAQRDAVKRKLSRLSELYVADMVSMADYKRQYQGLQDELAAIPEDESENHLEEIQSYIFPGWQSMYSELSRDSKQAFWRKILKAVYLTGHGVSGFELR